MNIISDISKDTQTPKPKPGSYEWWYFDAMTDDGYSIVVIFYDGNPFSRRYIQALQNKKSPKAGEYPAISISVYKDSKPLFYAFEELNAADSHFSEQEPNGSVGANSFTAIRSGSATSYKVTLNQSVPNGDTIKANLVFKDRLKGDLSGSDFNRISNTSEHTWNLVMPICRVEGEVATSGYYQEQFQFSGTGYHDHNTGFEPMKESFTEWYWGRYHLENQVLVYYLMNINGKWDKQAWLISDFGEVHPFTKKAELKNKGLSIFGLDSARSIEFNGSEQQLFIQKDKILDNGPFYQRFEGGLLFNNEGAIEQGRGISEYIYPSRIYNKFFWPIVNMRVKYPGNAHWVQKNPVLYRWTW